MTPILYILKIATEEEKIDLEQIGARLEHHKIFIQVRNSILSDCGDRWSCKLKGHEGNLSIEKSAPSMRTAIINSLKELNCKNEEVGMDYCEWMRGLCNAPWFDKMCIDCGGVGLKPVICCTSWSMDCGCMGTPVDFEKCDCDNTIPSNEQISKWGRGEK